MCPRPCTISVLDAAVEVLFCAVNFVQQLKRLCEGARILLIGVDHAPAELAAGTSSVIATFLEALRSIAALAPPYSQQLADEAAPGA